MAQSFKISEIEEKTPFEIEAKNLGQITLPQTLETFCNDFIYKETFELVMQNDIASPRSVFFLFGTDNIFKFSSIDVVRSVRGMNGIVAMEIVETKEIFYNGYLVPIRYRQYPENLQILFLKIPALKSYTIRLHIFDLVKRLPPTLRAMNSHNFIAYQQDFLKKTAASDFVSDLFVGAILVMFIFILSIYSQNGMHDFGLYALYLLSMLLFGILDMYPLNFKNFWGWEFPKIFIYLKESVVYLYLIFYHSFLNYFLNANKNKPSLHKGLIGFNILYGVLVIINLTAILFFFEPTFIRELTWLNTFVFYGSIIFYVYLFVILWQLRNIPFSRYIFWGSFTFYLSNVIAIFCNANFKNYNFALYPNNFIQIGVIAEIVFFAVALGRKALLDSEEKNKLQKQVILQLEEKKQLIEGINERLEKEVAEKTEEILAQTQILQAEKEEKMRLQFHQQIQELRLYAIQTQLNPHFLFNCLNTIKSLIMNHQNDKASLYLNQFAVLMRSTLENSEKLKINLKESIAYLSNYVSMEKLRFQEDFDFEIRFEGEEDPELLQVPPMLIQPFIENAIIHGLVPSHKQKKLTVLFIEEEDFLICKVIDNGKGFQNSEKKPKHQSKGLLMIQNYFELWNVQKHEKASFKIHSEENIGTEVYIQIPI
ncbi:MAG: hypothetical protein OHK0045_03850 [Raineya sp.]